MLAKFRIETSRTEEVGNSKLNIHFPSYYLNNLGSYITCKISNKKDQTKSQKTNCDVEGQSILLYIPDQFEIKSRVPFYIEIFGLTVPQTDIVKNVEIYILIHEHDDNGPG